MWAPYRIGELVHIPQSVRLLDCDDPDSPQLSIPLRFRETTTPELAIVTGRPLNGYVRIFCQGGTWSVKDQNIYRLSDVV